MLLSKRVKGWLLLGEEAVEASLLSGKEIQNLSLLIEELVHGLLLFGEERGEWGDEIGEGSDNLVVVLLGLEKLLLVEEVQWWCVGLLERKRKC